MNFSYYEVYINVLRAFTGMGFPYGADEDAAFIIAWLELNKLNGIKLLANSIDNIDQKYDGKINMYKVNIEEEPEIAGLFRVMSVPTTATISKSGDAQLTPGALNEETLKYFLDGLISKK